MSRFLCLHHRNSCMSNHIWQVWVDWTSFMIHDVYSSCWCKWFSFQCPPTYPCCDLHENWPEEMRREALSPSPRHSFRWWPWEHHLGTSWEIHLVFARESKDSLWALLSWKSMMWAYILQSEIMNLWRLFKFKLSGSKRSTWFSPHQTPIPCLGFPYGRWSWPIVTTPGQSLPRASQPPSNAVPRDITEKANTIAFRKNRVCKVHASHDHVSTATKSTFEKPKNPRLREVASNWCCVRFPLGGSYFSRYKRTVAPQIAEDWSTISIRWSGIQGFTWLIGLLQLHHPTLSHFPYLSPHACYAGAGQSEDNARVVLEDEAEALLLWDAAIHGVRVFKHVLDCFLAAIKKATKWKTNK